MSRLTLCHLPGKGRQVICRLLSRKEKITAAGYFGRVADALPSEPAGTEKIPQTMKAIPLPSPTLPGLHESLKVPL